MPNFYKENPDLLFHFERLDLQEITGLIEGNFTKRKRFAAAPANHSEAMARYRLVLERVGDLAGNFIAPRAAQVDEEGVRFEDGRVRVAPGIRESLDQLASAGFLGMVVPYEYGGMNLPFSVYAMAAEVIARADASLMNLFGLQDIADCIGKFGDEKQRQEFLPALAAGRMSGAVALTEPDAGSDLQAVRLTAEQDAQGNWRLRGMKRFITNGQAEVLLVLARSEPGTLDARGLSLFLCRGGAAVKVRRLEHKLGIRGSPTCGLEFLDAPAQLVGKRKLGLIQYGVELLFRARLGICAQALGTTQAAYEEAAKYARERQQFGRPIAEIPAVEDMLVELRVLLESGRTLFYLAAQTLDLKDQLGRRLQQCQATGSAPGELEGRLREVSRVSGFLVPLCKYLLAESANRATYDALQIHGGAGYLQSAKVGRLARDARITSIYEGTSQLQLVAAISGVVTDVMANFLGGKEARNYPSVMGPLVRLLKDIRQLGRNCLTQVSEKKRPALLEVLAKPLVELYAVPLIGYLLLEQAESEPRKLHIARRFIQNGWAEAQRNVSIVQSYSASELGSDREILG